MDALLRGEKPSEIIPFSLEEPVLYVPVRHHSPACALHLEQVIRRYQPDIILVEGPENANQLIPVLTHPDTVIPVALYYSFRDQERLLSPTREPGFYRCYYPFVDCSPELVALRAAQELQIPARFIDLPYARILLATQQAQGLRTPEEKISYANDRYLAHSRFQERLCQRAGVRHFEEFWEKYFESGGMTLSDEAFFSLMNVYCTLTREHTPEAELLEDGCLAREQHMAMRISEASATHKKVLVVAGGFHIHGLIHPQQDTVAPPLPEKSVQAVWPMRYTMPELDALSGYASGMPSPGFYDRVYRHLQNQEPASAWDNAILEYLIETGRSLRKKGESISASDEINAMDQARGLSFLREKAAPGLYELQDGVLSCFVKGAADYDRCEPLRVLSQLTTGDRVGKLCDGAPIPPLTRDFDEKCATYRLRRDAGDRQTLTLSIFTSDRHRKISRFLHQTVFLDCGFAVRKKGPDPVHRKDRNLIREIWEYRWSTAVDAALVEHSVSGATTEEACTAELKQKLFSASRSEEGAQLLLMAMQMGLGDSSGALHRRMEDLLIADGDFTSLCGAFAALDHLAQWTGPYGEPDSFRHQTLLERCFARILQLLPSMHSVDDRNVHSVQDACVMLNRITGQQGQEDRRDLLLDRFQMLTEHKDIHPALHGTVLGLLYGTDSRWKTNIDRTMRGYLQGTEAIQRKAAPFLQGLFLTARDLLLVDPEFLGQVDTLLCGLTGEAFLALLPELRLAFSYFLPRETDRIARRVAGLHGISAGELRRPGIDPDLFARGEALDAWATQFLDQITPEGGSDDEQ